MSNMLQYSWNTAKIGIKHQSIEMSILYRGVSYHVSVYLAERFQILEIDQPETRIAYGSYACWQIRTKWAIFTEDLP